MKYQFEHEDFSSNFRKNAQILFDEFKGKPTNYLEIGTLEGRSVCWMMDNILTHPLCRATCVDMKIRPLGWHNLSFHSKIECFEGNSRLIIPYLKTKFDIIYIDGDHSARGCLFDSVNCWELARDIILWDDYKDTACGCSVKKAVSNFLDCIPKNEYEVILDQNEQFAIRKR